MSQSSFCRFSFVVTFLSLLLSLKGQDVEVPIDLSLSDEVRADRIIESVMGKEKFPGLAVEVWKGGTSVYSKGYGYADVESQIPVNTKTSLFRIGSISKPYTAAALGVLYEAGKIDLDTPIQTYVSSFPEKEYPVTLRQLAGHLGGIRHYRGLEFMSNVRYPTVMDGLSIFADDPLIHEPGTKYAYSSYGWNLISAAIESAAEEEFLAYIQREVFDKIGMNHTSPDYADRDIAGRVTFYIKNSSGSVDVAPPVDNSCKWAGGGFISSVHDVAKFAQAHLDATLLSPETLALWTNTQYTVSGKPINYGIGWRSGEDKKGRAWYGHSGGSVGGTSFLIIYPEEELIVVTTVNQSSAKTGDLAFRIANQFF